MIDRKVPPGSLFEALQPLVTVADLSSVWVFLQAYEKDLALLHEGVPVTIRTEAFPHEDDRDGTEPLRRERAGAGDRFEAGTLQRPGALLGKDENSRRHGGRPF